MNLEAASDQNKDLRRLLDSGPSERRRQPTPSHWSFENVDRLPLPVNDDDGRDFADAGRSKSVGASLINDFPHRSIGATSESDGAHRFAGVAVC